jgi:hypothetical protein
MNINELELRAPLSDRVWAQKKWLIEVEMHGIATGPSGL